MPEYGHIAALLPVAMDRIAHSNCFTLIADIATSDLHQNDRNPRIISISEAWWSCNLQLDQFNDQLVVRVRSKATGRNGTDPECVAPGVFEDMNPRIGNCP